MSFKKLVQSIPNLADSNLKLLFLIDLRLESLDHKALERELNDDPLVALTFIERPTDCDQAEEIRDIRIEIVLGDQRSPRFLKY